MHELVTCSATAAETGKNSARRVTTDTLSVLLRSGHMRRMLWAVVTLV
jgi:hypothetical protein